LLDKTDLVFVDPVGTGYSSAVWPNKNVKFRGADSDAVVLRDFILRYVNVNNRQSSPKYIYGVSYGGFRAPIIGRLLIERGTTQYVPDPSNNPPRR
jgi:carboxypeptidase C (cathepsin A)